MADDIQLDDRLFQRHLSHLEKQIPFALALSLTKTAQAAQAELKEDLPRDFTLRTSWVPRGIRIKPAKKRDLEAHVGSTDENMALQARGGTSERGNVPLDTVRTTPKTRTTRGKWPGALARRKRVFVIKLRGSRGRGRLGLWQRESDDPYPIRPLYFFEPEIKIPKRWKFDDQVLRTMWKTWPEEVRKAIDRVLRDAR